MKTLALVCLLALGPAQAFAYPWATPPAKYVHPFHGRVMVLKNLTPFALGTLWPTYGFSYVAGNPPTCVIQVWNKYWSTSLYRHERAHCNGWPWWHPAN